jgi:hypothetical protein
MNIAWKYLDKRRGAAQAVRDYGSMQFILENTDDEIKKAYNGMAHLGSPGIDGMPHAHDPKAGEARLVAGIEEIDVLKERYRQAMEYMDWFHPAWEVLTDDERYVLKTFYGKSDNDWQSPVYQICERYKIERSSAYNRKNRALKHLTTLLFGRA